MGYPSDCTDAQFALIKEFFDVGNRGNRRKHSIQILVSAVFYVTKTGCQWRQLPSNFPPWGSVSKFGGCEIRELGPAPNASREVKHLKGLTRTN
jgi:transposase